MSDNTSDRGTTERFESGNSEQVAFDLLKLIMRFDENDRDEMLELYARCILTTKNPAAGLEVIKKAARGERTHIVK